MAAQSFVYGTNKRLPCSSSSSKPLDSFFISGSSPSFLGSRSMVSFEDGNRPFFQTFDQEDNGDDEYDDYFQQPEKKKRLKADQVQFLEKSFEAENKLEPERKIQLAKDLGLQPRQIAIWFQNRRARWKTKQLEKDYDVLQDSYNNLKLNYENLLKEKEKLKSEVRDLSDKLMMQEKAKGTSDSSNAKSLSEPPQQDQGSDCCLNNEDISKHMDLAQSNNADGLHSSLLERVDSSYMVEQDQISDGSLDEEENLGKMFLATTGGGYMMPKMENSEHRDHSCYFVGPNADDQDQPFDFWSY